MNLSDFPFVVTVWHQPGCGHCEEFLPRANATAQRYAHCGVPTVMIDATANTRLADGLNISATPTLIVLRRGRTVQRFNRGLEDNELEATYQALAKSCQAPPPGEPQLEAQGAELVEKKASPEPAEAEPATEGRT